jgi:hypothetical protein
MKIEIKHCSTEIKFDNLPETETTHAGYSYSNSKTNSIAVEVIEAAMNKAIELIKSVQVIQPEKK